MMFFNDIFDDIFQTLLERKKSSGSGGEDKFKPYIDGTLTELTAKDLKGLTEVLDKCFYATGLTSIELPYGVVHIGVDAFRDSKSLKVLVVPDSVKSVGQYAFGNLNLTDLTIGKKFTIGGYGGIFYQSRATNVYYNGNLIDLFNFGADGLQSEPAYPATNLYLKNSSGEYELLEGELVVPASISEIQPYIFYSYYHITSLIIPDHVTSIGKYSFYSLWSVKNVIVGKNVTSIGESGLNCGNSTYNHTVTYTFLSTTPPTIQSSSIANTYTMKKIIVPKGCGEAYKTATNWTKYADYIEEAAE